MSKSLGEIASEGYLKAAGIDNCWAELSPTVKEYWSAAAHAVANALLIENKRAATDEQTDNATGICVVQDN